MSTLEPRTPEENVVRGTLFALLAIPAGVIVFVLIWNLGFIASIVSAATAWLAVFLYRRGAGGTISRVGAFCITGVVVVAVGLSIYGGLVSEAAIGFGSASDISPLVAVSMPEFWVIFNQVIADPEVMGEYTLPIILAIAFAALGVFGTLRGVFKAQSEPALPPLVYGAPSDTVATPESETVAASDESLDPKAPTV